MIKVVRFWGRDVVVVVVVVRQGRNETHPCFASLLLDKSLTFDLGPGIRHGMPFLMTLPV